MPRSTGGGFPKRRQAAPPSGHGGGGPAPTPRSRAAVRVAVSGGSAAQINAAGGGASGGGGGGAASARIAKQARQQRKAQRRQHAANKIGAIRKSLRHGATLPTAPEKQYLQNHIQQKSDKLWPQAKAVSGLTGPPPQIKVGGKAAPSGQQVYVPAGKAGKKVIHYGIQEAADLMKIRAKGVKAYPHQAENARGTLIHEYTHVGQARAGQPRTKAQVEGRAERFASRLSKKLQHVRRPGIANAEKSTYAGFVKKSRRKDSGREILYGQFKPAKNRRRQVSVEGQAPINRRPLRASGKNTRATKAGAKLGRVAGKAFRQKRHQVKQALTSAARKSGGVNVNKLPDMGNLHQVAPLVAKYQKKYAPTVPVSVLMAQIEQESGFQPGLTSSAGAFGETQFIPSTAASYGVHPGTSKKAIKSQLKGQAKLMGSTAKDRGVAQALGDYYGDSNPQGSYAQSILAKSRAYKAADKPKSKPIPKGIKQRAKAVLGGKTTHQIIERSRTRAEPIKHTTHFKAAVKAANELNKLHLPYSLGSGHTSGPVPSPKQLGALDCSSTVSWILQRAGYDVPTSVSGNMTTWGKPGPGAITIFANAEHTFLRIGGRYYGTSHSNPGGGPGWIPTSFEQGEAQSGKYVVRHMPGAGKMSDFPGINFGPGGTTAAIAPGSGTVLSTPGFSASPIQSDRSAGGRQRLAAAKDNARRKRSAVAIGRLRGKITATQPSAASTGTSKPAYTPPTTSSLGL